jgi:hypothetical protein
VHAHSRLSLVVVRLLCVTTVTAHTCNGLAVLTLHVGFFSVHHVPYVLHVLTLVERSNGSHDDTWVPCVLLVCEHPGTLQWWCLTRD